MRRTPGALILALLLPMSASGQAAFPDANGSSLAGVKAFDARVFVAAWMDSSSDNIARWEQNAQQEWELRLRRDGVVVEASAPNYLMCNFAIADADGLMAYTWEVEYYAYQSSGVHTLLWKASGIVTVGRSNFSHESAVQHCADAFANEWLRWNPR